MRGGTGVHDGRRGLCRDPHRPQLRRTDCHADLSAHWQLRRYAGGFRGGLFGERVRRARVLRRAVELPHGLRFGNLPQRAGRPGAVRTGHAGIDAYHPRQRRDERGHMRYAAREPVGGEGLPDNGRGARRDLRGGDGTSGGRRTAVPRGPDGLRREAEHSAGVTASGM